MIYGSGADMYLAKASLSGNFQDKLISCNVQFYLEEKNNELNQIRNTKSFNASNITLSLLRF